MNTRWNRTAGLAIGIVAAGALALVLLSSLARAERNAAPEGVTTPTLISFQGKVTANGTPYSGVGSFKFAVVNAAGNTSYWSNDGTSAAGSEPTAIVPLTVTNGLFSVLLGDTTQSGMSAPLGASVFSASDRRLRVWFSTTGLGGSFERLTPDYAIGAVPFALNAETFDGLDSSVFLTSAQADARYARISPNPQQIALLKWYIAITGTGSTFAVGSGPYALAFDGVNIWVASNSGSNVSVLRASDGFRVMTPTVGSGPWGLAFDGANMWVANGSSNNVSVLRASDGYKVMTPTTGLAPVGLAFDGANMWVANFYTNTVSVLRASDGYHVMTPTVGSAPWGIAFDGANMWVANQDSSTVSVLRASDGYHVMTPTVGTTPFGIAFDGTNMWVACYSSNSVWVLRASDSAFVRSVPVGSGPVGIAFDGANMWVANNGSGTVSVLRASDGALVKTVPVGTQPIGIAFDGANMWVVNYGSNTVSKR